MLFGVDLESWLRQRSKEVLTVGTERHYVHSAKVRSVLIPTLEPKPIEPKDPSLSVFYRAYVGGSICNSMLMLASPGSNGIQLSLGYEIPSMAKLRQVAREHDLQVETQDELFMVGSAWMFFFAPGNPATEMLHCYDRDYHEMSDDRSFAQILQETWDLMTAG